MDYKWTVTYRIFSHIFFLFTEFNLFGGDQGHGIAEAWSVVDIPPTAQCTHTLSRPQI